MTESQPVITWRLKVERGINYNVLEETSGSDKNVLYCDCGWRSWLCMSNKLIEFYTLHDAVYYMSLVPQYSVSKINGKQGK